MRYDIVCIGHITKDKIVTPKATVNIPGGTATYFSYGISRMENKDISYKLVTALAQEDMYIVEDMRKAGIEVEAFESPCTDVFENIYTSDDMNQRQQRVLATAQPFNIEQLKNVDARYIVLGSLLATDFGLPLVKYFSAKATLVVDAQGYLREVREQKVFATDWKEKLEALKHIDVLKVNEHEIKVLTGIDDYREACQQLAQWGVKEVLLTLGSEGSMILTDRQFYIIPAYAPLNEKDATGCGDTYVMSYLYKRAQGADIEDAGKFAAAVSTLKLENSGPFSRTEQEVMELLRTNA